MDASVAAKAQADLEKLQTLEVNGRGSAPYADKNHEDAEATFHPVKFFWAGEDPKTGGVRVQARWTPFGASLVRARAFKYFSGNFLFDKTAKKFLSLINENIGGLVNRPGFAAQQAFAKAGVILEPPSRQVAAAVHDHLMRKFENISTIQKTLDLIRLIRELKHESGLSAADVKSLAETICEANSGDHGDSCDPKHLKKVSEILAALAKAHQRTGVGFEKAWTMANNELFFARGAADQRRANEVYNRTVELQHGEGLPFIEAHARATMELSTAAPSQTTIRSRATHAFKAHAKSYAAAHGLSELDGQTAFARTPEGRALYEQGC